MNLTCKAVLFDMDGLVAGVWVFTDYLNNRPYTSAPVDDSAALAKAEDAYSAVGNLLTTLATGLLAGLGLFLTSTPKQRYSAREIWPPSVPSAHAFPYTSV